MMNGKDATGRAVSLLNNEGQLGEQDAHQSSRVVAHSTSSIGLHPSPSPLSHTPDSLESETWSSHNTGTPSPKTPMFSYMMNPNLAAEAELGKHYLLIPQSPDHCPKSRSSPAVNNRTVPSPLVLPQAAPAVESDSPSPPADSPTTVISKGVLKRFPCQFAGKLGCTETFTTSGHASRHAKKHTGEKSVACPKCPKRFARKDNMKQHLKTHEQGRAAEKHHAKTFDANQHPREERVERQRNHLKRRVDASLPTLDTELIRRSIRDAESPQFVDTHRPSDLSPSGRRPLRYTSPTRLRQRSRGPYSPTMRGALPNRHTDARGPLSASTVTPGLDALVLAANADIRA
ncbi:MAG: hypothetical protein M1833_005412 [Piccolia ochrophora]|nr:MAG: hypothetical protein M1833_005412 [Piccolia ochrophora]